MQRIKAYTFLIILCSIIGINFLHAQNTPYAERLVTLKAAGMPLSKVFKKLTEQTGAEFSYTRLNDKQKISKSWYKKPLSIVVNDIFRDISCTYKIKDKYVIIRCNEQIKKTPAPPSVLTGYVYNAADSSGIENASIYIKQDMNSSLSDKFGHFKLSYSNTHTSLSLSVAKESYRDTTLIIYSKPAKEILIYLYPVKKLADTAKPVIVNSASHDSATPKPISDSIKTSRFRKQMNLLGAFMKNNANFRNINDTLFRKISFSLVPPISTNKLLSVNTVNKVSVNLISGATKGIDIFEIGGLLNIDNGNVRYFQAAGLGNIVNGNVKGMQLSGILNMNSKHTAGFQVAGLYNQSQSMDGMQTAGLSNNTSGRMEGIQIAGLVNYADSVNGLQLAGMLNIAGHVSGCQVSGLLNIAEQMNGLQLSVFNYAGKCKGVPFGFFSYVKNGYHKIEISQDEMAFTYFALRTGVDKFHNIFFAGKPLFSNHDLWTYGYGLGTAPAIGKKLHFVSELTSQQMLSTSLTDLRLNLLSRVFAGLEYRFKPYFSIAAGPSYNIIVSDVNGKDYLAVNDNLPVHPFFNTTGSKVNIRMWLGAKISVKFF